MPLTLTQLAVVHAVAAEGSVSRAAERLMVSQPAVSKQLRELERQVGAPLFDRLPRGVRATQAGTLLAGYAGRIFALAAEAEERLAELRGLARGELRVGASTTIAVYLLPPVFAAFRRAHPGVRLVIDIANATEIGRRLSAGGLDVALSEGEPDPADFDATPFLTDDLIAIAPPGHPFARRRGAGAGSRPGTRLAACKAAEVCGEPFVVREPGSGTRAVVERALAARGLSVTPVMTAGNTGVIKRAVAAGVGVAFVSRLACKVELRTGELVELKTGDLTITRPLYRIRVRGRHEGPAVAEFDRLLREAVGAFRRRPARPR